MRKQDLKFIRASFEVARRARSKTNHPFGALLVDKYGHLLLEAENTVVTERDCTGHAETNLMRLASKKYSRDFLATSTLYSSTEPCPMCCGAIFWGNVKRVIFGLGAKSLCEMIGETSDEVLLLPCREIFNQGRKSISVLGPTLEDEARLVHADFWGKSERATDHPSLLGYYPCHMGAHWQGTG